MTRPIPLLFVLLALSAVLGCCHGATCLSEGGTEAQTTATTTKQGDATQD